MLDFELSFSFVSGTELRFSGDFKNAFSLVPKVREPIMGDYA
jgi:hypothetical protein